MLSLSNAEVGTFTVTPLPMLLFKVIISAGGRVEDKWLLFPTQLTKEY
jgi:hypothetical protein